MNIPKVLFVSGIDTDAGKTYATGWLARKWMNEGKKVATVKFIQTGCIGSSEDIEVHRKIMGVEIPEDNTLLTSPLIFSYPASAQLAAKLDNKKIELAEIDDAIGRLGETYDIILVEGAGGLMVPVSNTFFSIDYPLTRQLPLILVTNGILGSINHTVLSLEAIRNRDMTLFGIAYNHYFDKDEVIADDTQSFIKRYVHHHFPESLWFDIPKISFE